MAATRSAIVPYARERCFATAVSITPGTTLPLKVFFMRTYCCARTVNDEGSHPSPPRMRKSWVIHLLVGLSFPDFTAALTASSAMLSVLIVSIMCREGAGGCAHRHWLKRSRSIRFTLKLNSLRIFLIN